MHRLALPVRCQCAQSLEIADDRLAATTRRTIPAELRGGGRKRRRPCIAPSIKLMGSAQPNRDAGRAYTGLEVCGPVCRKPSHPVDTASPCASLRIHWHCFQTLPQTWHGMRSLLEGCARSPLEHVVCAAQVERARGGRADQSREVRRAE